MKTQELRDFSEQEHNTWQNLYSNLTDNRKTQADPLFAKGLEALQMTGEHVPDLSEINARLMQLTGWKGVPVEGLEDGGSFFRGLKNREFPIGNFIREPGVNSYTPAPDIFHDLYGHIPFFADQDYADFNQQFGEVASKYADNPTALTMLERLYWFGVEFPLIDTPDGRKILGAGLLSSIGESNYSLSDKPTVLPFDLEKIAAQDYRIDVFQEILFVLDSKQKLYTCLAEFEQIVTKIV